MRFAEGSETELKATLKPATGAKPAAADAKE